jgi:hypothetical protein
VVAERLPVGVEVSEPTCFLGCLTAPTQGWSVVLLTRAVTLRAHHHIRHTKLTFAVHRVSMGSTTIHPGNASPTPKMLAFGLDV